MATTSLETRIGNLPEGVDAQLREELGQLVRMLRDVANPIAVLILLSRLSLRLMRIIYEKAGHDVPSDNLYDCLVTAGRGDSEHKIKGLKIVPDEIITGLHTVRTLSNKSDHAAEGVTLSAADAENALNLYLRALEWFYFEADFGPRLARASRRRRVKPPLLALAGLLVVVVLGIIVLMVRKDHKGTGPNDHVKEDTLPQDPAPLRLPEWARNISATPVLTLLTKGKPPSPTGEFARPQFQLDLLGRRKGQKDFRPLKDGDPLASRVDDYLLVIRPQTPGFLYVFQLDSRGTLTWLFPGNPTWELSSGTNPLAAGKRLRIPPEERNTALFLDTTVGIEHVVAVYSAVRWTELEEALDSAARKTPSGVTPVPEPLLVTRGVEEPTRAPGGTRPIGEEGKQSVEVVLQGERVRLDLAAHLQAAMGSFMVVSRWFRHVEVTEP